MDSQEERDTKSAEVLAQALCVVCGLCCDGTVGPFATIEPEEDVIRLRRIGITTICDNGKKFVLPCKLFDQICTIYHTHRAMICGNYRCKLLKCYDRGVISYESAAEIIRQTKDYKEKAQAALLAVLGANEDSLWQQYQNILASPAELKSSAHRDAEFNYLILQLQLDRYFRRSADAATPKFRLKPATKSAR